MAISPNFSDFVRELLAGLGPVAVKRLFGGGGVYIDGVMFALIDDDVLYFKADDALAADLRALGSVAWTYSKRGDGAARETGYWRMPESAADDPEEAVALGRRAYDAALRARSAKPVRKPRKNS